LHRVPARETLELACNRNKKFAVISFLLCVFRFSSYVQSSYRPPPTQTSERSGLEEIFSMKTLPASKAGSHGIDLVSIIRIGTIAVVIALICVPLFSSSSASSIKQTSTGRPSAAADVHLNTVSANRRSAVPATSFPVINSLATAGLSSAFVLSQTIETFSADCLTAKSVFNLGDVICVKVTGAPDGLRLALINPSGFIVDTRAVTADPQQETFQLPTTQISTIAGFFTAQNRGTWLVNLIAADNSVSFTNRIDVKDPQGVAADVSITKGLVSGDLPTGSGQNVVYNVVVNNYGPDDAANVSFTDQTPSNTTFVSLTQLSGPTFACTKPTVGASGTTTCTIATLPWNGNNSAIFEIVYQSSSATGSIQAGDVAVTSTTADITTDNNVGSGPGYGVGGSTASTCDLTCPSNITATADTVQDVDGVPTNGTIVTFGSGSSTGTCGAISANPASGSFFPVGTTPVTVSSSDGASCTFLVTVTTSGSPVSISCPSNVTANASSDCEASVTLGTPTTTGDNVTVTSTRSDGKPLSAGFPTGTTTVTWTATNSSATESCSQTVTVVDVTPPVITVDAPAPASADASCQAAIPDLTAVAQVSDNCACSGSDQTDSCVGREAIAVVQSPAAGTLVGLGSHQITLTANDGSDNNGGAGNSTSVTVNFVVSDITAPTFTSVPADVTVYTGGGATTCDTVVDPGTALASDNCVGPVTVTRAPTGNTFPVGTTNVVWTATDAAGNTATATQHVTVNDNTVPTITAPANKTLYTGAGATSCGVTVSDLNAALGTATAADNCPGVTWARSGGSVFPVGNTPVTYTATDAHGNTASATQTVTVVDNTPPVVTPPANITVNLPLNSTATSMAVSYPNPATATDNCAGTITFNYSPASGSVFPVGTTTVTVTATDAHSNSATATFTVTVLYNFTGFFSPVSNAPTLNSVNAGKAIPVKFSLSGNKGLDIFAAGSPSSVSLSCASGDPGVDIVETVNAGGSSLSFGGDQYNYVWKTESSWAGTCRQLRVTLNDGSVHVANFKFK
jgi:uncharacterized repeat protein (TIGR01451 family)